MGLGLYNPCNNWCFLRELLSPRITQWIKFCPLLYLKVHTSDCPAYKEGCRQRKTGNEQELMEYPFPVINNGSYESSPCPDSCRETLFPWWLLLIYVLVCLTSTLENRCRDAISGKESNACSEFLADSKLQFSFLCHNLRSMTCNCSIFSVTNSCNSLIIMLCSPAVL